MKKLISLGVISALALSSLTGCSNQAQKDGGSGGKSVQPAADQKPVISFEGIVSAVEDGMVTLEDGTVVCITEDTLFGSDPDGGSVVSRDIQPGSFIQGYTEDSVDSGEVTAENIQGDRKAVRCPGEQGQIPVVPRPGAAEAIFAGGGVRSMTGKELYRAVGQIEDELILAANEEPAGKQKTTAPLWVLVAAACFYLVCAGAFRHLFGTSIVWNEGPGMTVSKSAIPEGSVPQELTAEAAADYYRVGQIPAVLGQALRLVGPDTFLIYSDSSGTTVYDSIQLRYEHPDGSAAARLFPARVSAPELRMGKPSRIRGVPVTLTASEGICSAQWEQSGTYVCIMGNGVEQEAFIVLVEELLAGRKGK